MPLDAREVAEDILSGMMADDASIIYAKDHMPAVLEEIKKLILAEYKDLVDDGVDDDDDNS